MMINLVKSYLANLKIEDIKKVAQKNNITLSECELEFTFNFIKNNYEEVLKEPKAFNFSDYKEHYTEENYEKINNLIKKYYNYL